MGQLPIESLTVDSLHAKNELFPHLHDRVFHVTPRLNLDSILASGFIHHNGDGRFPFASEGSENSFGRLHNRGCVFDFRNQSEQTLFDLRGDYTWDDPFRTHVSPYEDFPAPTADDSAAYLFLGPAAFGNLIPARDAIQDEPILRTLMREVEWWWQGNLPVSLISSALIVQFDRTNEREEHARHARHLAAAFAEIERENPHGDYRRNPKPIRSK